MIKTLVILLSMLTFCTCFDNSKSTFINKQKANVDSINSIKSNETGNAVLKPKDTLIVNSFETAMQIHFNHIGHFLIYDNLDSAVIENNLILNSVEKYKEEIFNISEKVDNNLYKLTKSKDGKLCIISWDTRLGGTSVDFATIAVFKSKDKIFCKKIISGQNEYTHEDEYFQMRYSKILTLNENLYIANGIGQGSTALPWEDVLALQINGKDLIFKKIFPNNKFRILVEFDAHQFDGKSIPVIIFENEGKILKIPESNDKEGFDGKYQQLIFDGNVFLEK
jgi:hypothetical protein